MLNNLAKICTDKTQHIERNEHLIPEIVHIERAKLKPQPLKFANTINAKKQQGEAVIITEVYKALPHKGLIRDNFDPAIIALAYQKGGASCISVKTDTPYFKGSDDDLETVKSVTHIPVMRDDFIMTPYQVYESRALGADCISLIPAILDDETLHKIYNLATNMNMDVMVEIYNEHDLNRALPLNPKMIAVNACNFETFKNDNDKLFSLIDKIPTNIIRIAENINYDENTIKSLHNAGYDAFLVGEYLLRQNNIELATKNFLANI